MDDVRGRRLARVAARREVVPPRPPDPGPADALRVRAAGIDRAQRFRERLAAVERESARGRDRSRRIRALEVVGLISLALVLALFFGSTQGPSMGVVIGLASLGISLVARRAAAAAARQRGASAWDWKLGKHVLWGKPAERVQKADRATSADPRR